MPDILTALSSLWTEHQYWLMFVSAFLSATVLPANSEIIFVGLAAKMLLPASQYFSTSIIWLLATATIGNTLGGLTTYWLGRCFPKTEFRQARAQWVMDKCQKYGAWALLFSWLPVIGDLFCAVAGWLRLNVWQATLAMLIGKFLRYLFLLQMVISYTFW